MNSDAFLTKLQAIDSELARNEVPIYARSCRAYDLFSPHYNGDLYGCQIDHSLFGDYEWRNLEERINDWYKDVYAERFNAPTDRGRVPVILRKEVYLIRIPLVASYRKIETWPLFKILPLVNGLTNSLVEQLSPDESQKVQEKFYEGFYLVYEFEYLRKIRSKNGFMRKENPFLDSALRDLDTASDCLEGKVDTNGAIFHSQQLSEKMLKAVLLHEGNMTKDEIKKKYSHKLLELYKDVCTLIESESTVVHSEIKKVAKHGMDIRYTSTVVKKDEAVSVYWSALRIGSLCARLLRLCYAADDATAIVQKN